MSETKQFECNDRGMVEAQAFFESICSEPKPAIIMDEIVSNIVRCSGATDFIVSVERLGDGMKMVFTDNGKPFDPTREIAAPDINAALEDRQIGGLGIFMVKKMAKSVEYARKGDKNELTVIIPS